LNSSECVTGIFVVTSTFSAWNTEIVSRNKHLNISFKLNNLLLLKERNPDQSAQYLVEKDIDDALIQEMADRKMGIDAFQYKFTEEIIQKCRTAGVETNAWTVNNPDMARKLMDWGIDYITTNILE
jgi:glycerophosphoryl diester phosphodiesterase